MPEEEIVVEEEDYLAGLCEFPDEVNAKPSQIRIASPFIGFSDLIKALVVDTEDGPKEVPYVPGSTKKDEKILGFIKDQLTIDFLQKAYNGRGILVASPENPNKLLTIEQWEAKYDTDPVALVLMMRMWWKSPVADIKYVKLGGDVRKWIDADGQSRTGKVEYVKLGAGGRTTIR